MHQLIVRITSVALTCVGALVACGGTDDTTTRTYPVGDAAPGGFGNWIGTGLTPGTGNTPGVGGIGAGNGGTPGGGPNCGNGRVDPGEDCDGTILNNATCASVTMNAMPGGTLTCATCRFNLAGCQGGGNPGTGGAPGTGGGSGTGGGN